MGCCQSDLTKNQIDSDKKIESDTSPNEVNQLSQTPLRFHRKQFICISTGKLRDNYEITEQLGSGAFGSVRRGIHKNTGIPRAIKSILKSYVRHKKEKTLLQEVDLLSELDHPNIISVIKVFQDFRYFHIVTELCTGGELFARIVKQKNFSENQAAKYIYQILSAVQCCHSNRIVHRDLKPENILFQNEYQNSQLKIIDFGVSSVIQEDEFVGKYGTPYYMAPEVIQGRYDEKCDVWSCGVILYILLCGYPPFNAKEDKEIINRILNQKLQFPQQDWQHISQEAQDLIRKMLTKDPRKRISAGEAFQHEWVQSRANDMVPDQPLIGTLCRGIFEFRAYTKFRHAALSYIATQLTSQREIENLSELFRQLDKNGDGKLSAEELREGIHSYCIGSQGELDRVFEECDADGNGYIDYSEFITATINWNQVLSRKKLHAAFREMDIDGNGIIDIQELGQLLGGQHYDEEFIQGLMNEIDTNGDGNIDMQEFCSAILKVNSQQSIDVRRLSSIIQGQIQLSYKMSQNTVFLKNQRDKIRRENRKLKEILMKSEKEMNQIIQRNEIENQQLFSLFNTVWPRIQAKLSQRQSEGSASTYLSSCSSMQADKGVQFSNKQDRYWELHVNSLEQTIDTIEFAVQETLIQREVSAANQIEIKQHKKNLVAQKDEISKKLSDAKEKKQILLGKLQNYKNQLESAKIHIQMEEEPVPAFILATLN